MIGVICQARSKSTRFFRKIWEPIENKTTLQWVLDGVAESKMAQKVVLAMPLYDMPEVNAKIADTSLVLPDERFNLFFGEPEDVLKRYYDAALRFGIDVIVRVTCDCPLINGKLIDYMLVEYMGNNYNGFMGCNKLVSAIPYPDGIDCDIFKWYMLAETYWKADEKNEREHVTPYMYRKNTQYEIHQYLNTSPSPVVSTKIEDLSFDTPEDLCLLKKIIREYNRSIESGHDTILALNNAIGAHRS